MAKAYWVGTYRSISNPEALAAYAKIGGPAIEAAGGHFLARGLASEFAPHNIRVNVVSPGSINTSRANPEWYGNRPPDASGIPLGRQGKIDEIAATCLFLVCESGGFITGQTIHVNGGAAYY